MISSPPFRSHASPTIVPDHLFDPAGITIPHRRAAPRSRTLRPPLAAGLLAFVGGMLLAAVVVGASLWMTAEAPVVDAPLGVFSLEH